MQVFENKEFRRQIFADRDSAGIYGDLEFRRCYFESYFLSLTNSPALRSTVRNVQLVDCSQRGCTLYSAIVEDVLIDGLKTNGQLLRGHGAVFNRVVLRGKIDRLMFSNDILSAAQDGKYQQREIALFRAANLEYYRHVDWALDISRGEFQELDIRGVPGHLIRRDPETQIMVTRQRALQEDWRNFEFHAAVIPFSLNLLLQWGLPDIVLIAPKRHRKFRDYLEDLRLLRKAGIAEPDL